MANKPIITLGAIVRKYGGQYLAMYGSRMLPGHIKALYAIAKCHTIAAGGHIERCDHCGYEHYFYHSCKNRNCPQCQQTDNSKWFDDKCDDILPVPYFHIVFTLPKGLQWIVRSNQKTFYPFLMTAAAESLKKLCQDPRYLGGKIGLYAVLHTWNRMVAYHPHVHCLVPGIGLAPDKQSILLSKKNFLVPVKALSKIFRGIFMEMISKEIPASIRGKLKKQEWCVNIKPAVYGVEKILQYLSRYLHRIAITNNRIIADDDGVLTIRYRRNKDTRWKTMKIDAIKFIGLFLQHVLPKGFHKVRYYGILSPANKKIFLQIKRNLQLQPTVPAAKVDTEVKEKLPEPTGQAVGSDDPTTQQAKPDVCPKCKNGYMRFGIRLEPQLHPFFTIIRPPPALPGESQWSRSQR